MGYSSWSPDAYATLKADYATKSKDQIFTNTKTPSDMSPHGVAFRESRDSDAHPETLAIQVYLDETGSMGNIPHILVSEKLGNLIETLVKHGIPYPAILFGGIGDHHSDTDYLQVGQFENGTKELNHWLTSLYLEGHGGGQNRESYLLAYNFAARHVTTDNVEKRGIKNFLWTIGDEATWEEVDGDTLKRLMGYKKSEGITIKQILAEAQRTNHVFHIHINEADHKDDKEVIGSWRKLLGERLIILDDYNAVSETIATTVAVMHGVDLQDVVKDFDRQIAKTVTDALVHIKSDIVKSGAGIAQL